MKVIISENQYYVLRFDKDEEVLSGLLEFAKAAGVNAAYFSAIGACSQVQMGFFNEFLKNYREKPYMDNREIGSLTGNIATVNGQPTLHAHGVFSNSDFEVVAGHVFKLIVSATCEVFLLKFEGPMNRGLNPNFNLNLLV